MNVIDCLSLYLQAVYMYLLFSIVIGLVCYKLFSLKKRKKKKFNGDLSFAEKSILSDKVSFYNRLSDKNKTIFTGRIAEFLSSVTITAVDCKLSKQDYIFLGASAIIPIFGFKNWDYHNLNQIYVFPDAFNYKLHYKGKNNDRRILGMVGNGFMTNKMIISQKALRHGFENNTDKKNTAIHEFVHLIDMADGKADGIPMEIMDKPYVLPWLDLMHFKTTVIDNDKSDINPYAASSKVEFFAVVSEYFFERPKLLKRKHPKLYSKLALFFKQDLA